MWGFAVKGFTSVKKIFTSVEGMPVILSIYQFFIQQRSIFILVHQIMLQLIHTKLVVSNVFSVLTIVALNTMF